MKPRSLAAVLVLACLAWSDAAWAQAALSPQSPLYKELVPHFRAFQHDLAVLAVKDRRRVDAAADVVVVEATARNMDRMGATVEEQMRQHSFGVFVVDRATSRRRFTVDIFPTERRLDYVVKIRDVSVERLGITREGGTYGDVFDQITYFWDLPAGKVVERLAHGYFGITDLVEHDGVLWVVGSDGTRGGLLTMRPGNTSPVDTVAAIEGQPLPPILEARSEPDALVLLGATTRYAWRAGRWERSPNPHASRYQQGGMVPGAPFGLPDVEFWVAEYLVRRHTVTIGARKFLVWSSAIAPNAHGAASGPGIWEIDGGRQFHAMPAPTYDAFAKLRPRRVKDGYTRESTHLETEIGPIQIEGRRIWFGTTFYDGESISGLGGTGSFDTDTRRWHLVHPPAVVDWSSSAILVEPDAVWLGLVHNTEGRGRTGGLVRWDRTSGGTKRIAIAPAITAIRRFGGPLYLGTSDGLIIVDGAKLTHVRLVPRRGGGLRAVTSALHR